MRRILRNRGRPQPDTSRQFPIARIALPDHARRRAYPIDVGGVRRRLAVTDGRLRRQTKKRVMRFELTTFTLATRPGSEANRLLAQAFTETHISARSRIHSSRNPHPGDSAFQLNVPINDTTLLAAALVWSHIPPTSLEIIETIIAQTTQAECDASD